MPLSKIEVEQALVASLEESLEGSFRKDPLESATVLEDIGADSLTFISVCVRFQEKTGLMLADGKFDRPPETIGDLIRVAIELQDNRREP